MHMGIDLKIRTGDVFYWSPSNKTLTVKDVHLGIAVVSWDSEPGINICLNTNLIKEWLLSCFLRRIGSTTKEDCTWV